MQTEGRRNKDTVSHGLLQPLLGRPGPELLQPGLPEAMALAHCPVGSGMASVISEPCRPKEKFGNGGAC